MKLEETISAATLARIAGDNLACRPKRRGLAWQELRAQAALLVEWLRISWREGWLGSARRNKKGEARNALSGEKRTEGLRRFRERIGLILPYGASGRGTRNRP